MSTPVTVRDFPNELSGIVDPRVQKRLTQLFEMIYRMQQQLDRIPTSQTVSAQVRQQLQLLGVLREPLLGQETADPQLSAVASAPGTGTVTSVSANNTVSGLVMTISSPTSVPVINLSGTPNIAGSNVTSGTIDTARLPATINIATAYQIGSTQVVNARKTGWTAWTGTADRTTHDTGTATLTNVLQAFKGLLDDLISHGLVGA